MSDPRTQPRSHIYPGSHPIGRLHFYRRDKLKRTIGAFPMDKKDANRALHHGIPLVRVGGYRKPGQGQNAAPKLVHHLPKRTTPLAWKMWHPGYKFDFVPGKKPLTDQQLFTHEAYKNAKDGQVPFDYWHKQGQKPGARNLTKPATATATATATEGAKTKKSGSSSGTKRKKQQIKIRVQSFGKKKTATAVAFIRNGRGAIKVNSQPLKLVRPEILRYKIYEPILIVGERRFSGLNMRIRVSGGGHTSKVYAIRQAMAKALVAYYAKYKDAASALELKKLFIAYDRTLLISDPRRMEAKKFGGRGARARRQKSYR